MLVIGGGPAGLAAAIAAAEAGAETLLDRRRPQLGGSLLYGRDGGDRASVVARRADLVHRARAMPNLRIMTGTTVTGLFADNWASATRGNRLYKIRARRRWSRPAPSTSRSSSATTTGPASCSPTPRSG